MNSPRWWTDRLRGLHNVNAAISVAVTTQEVIARFHDGVEVRREMGRDETFWSIDKARDLLGYEPQHSWRDVFEDPRGNR